MTIKIGHLVVSAAQEVIPAGFQEVDGGTGSTENGGTSCSGSAGAQIWVPRCCRVAKNKTPLCDSAENLFECAWVSGEWWDMQNI